MRNTCSPREINRLDQTGSSQAARFGVDLARDADRHGFGHGQRPGIADRFSKAVVSVRFELWLGESGYGSDSTHDHIPEVSQFGRRAHRAGPAARPGTARWSGSRRDRGIAGFVRAPPAPCARASRTRAADRAERDVPTLTTWLWTCSRFSARPLAPRWPPPPASPVATW
jgi:hypothetical protein